MHDLIEVFVRDSKPDLTAGQYQVVLQDKTSNRVLSIWVGHYEGNAIALALEEVWTPRPMTHDLMANMLKNLNVQIERVIITDLKDNTFYAVICLRMNGTEMSIDSRPSDALALAVRTKCPILVSKKLSEKMVDSLDEVFERMEPNQTIH